MPVSFVQPVYLWLLLLLVPVWLLALAAPSRLARWRRLTSLGLRTIILLAIVLALSGAQIVWPASETTTIFLVDHSDSVSPVERARAESFIRDALSHKPSDDRAAIVVFGGDAVVERAPSVDPEFVRTTVTPPSDQTDVARALDLALALLPAETQKRIVLLSDGAETRGNALESSRAAQAAGVPIDTVALISPPSADDVALESLQGPATAREGQQVRLTVEARSGRATTARLTLLRDRQPVLETNVQLDAGLNRIPLSVPAPPPGFHGWEARIEAPGDTVGANNVQFGFIEVRGAPRVLLVEGAPGRAASLAAALQAARLNPVTIAPGDMPESLIGLDAYDVIALVDVPYRALPERAALLPVYVRELGRGLLMVGGEESYAAGGYLDTPVESALPVIMRTRGVRIQPDVALVLVIDRSGSMAGQKLDLAKEGAAQAFVTLDERDQIGVIAFDTSASWAVPLQPKPAADEFLGAVGGIALGGGTDLRPGLAMATEALEQANARIKHIVILTDGQADRNYDDVVERMQAAGITLTSVGIEDFDPYLREVAPRTGGRFYHVQNLNDVPRLFFDESLRIARRGIVEREFTPVVTYPAPVVRDLRAVPPLHGYNAVTPKDTAQVILQSDEADPILAQWQYGLGRAAAWTSDMKGQWAADWIAWDGFGSFAARLVGDLLPAPNVEGFEAEASIVGTALALELRADDGGGRARTGLRPLGRLIAGDGTTLDVPLLEVEPGRYRGTAPLPGPGVYRVQVRISDGDSAEVGVVSTGAVVPPSAEYLQRDGNPALLEALAQRTGGRIEVAPERVWDAPATDARRTRPITWPLLWLAALLWPIDIALRRLFVPAPQPRAVTAWVRTRAARRAESPPINLDRRRAQVRAQQRTNHAAPDDSRPVAPPPPSSQGTHFDWRRARRGVVERPGERRE